MKKGERNTPNLPNILISDPNKYTGETLTKSGINALMEACKVDNEKGVELLIKNGANPIT